MHAQHYSRSQSARPFDQVPKPTKKMRELAAQLPKSLFSASRDGSFVLRYSKNTYSINLDREHCSCHNYIKYQLCGHLVAAKKHFGKQVNKYAFVQFIETFCVLFRKNVYELVILCIFSFSCV